MFTHILVESSALDRDAIQRYALVGQFNEEACSLNVVGITDERDPVVIAHYTVDTPDLQTVPGFINDALGSIDASHGIHIARCVISGAGPLSRKGNYINLTRYDLRIDKLEILRETLLRQVVLLNSFVAVSYGVSTLKDDTHVTVLPHLEKDLTELHLKHSPRAAIGINRGLGTSIMSYDQRTHRYIPIPSEGGHMALVATDDPLEQKFVTYLRKNIMSKPDAFPECERVLSVHGLSLLYHFLLQDSSDAHKDVTDHLEQVDEQHLPEAIVAHHLECPVCMETLRMFLRFYARAARNVAFMGLCYSGLFLVGPLSHLITDDLQKEFMEEFLRHDIRSDVLRKIPVFIVDPSVDLVLRGCCRASIDLLQR